MRKSRTVIPLFDETADNPSDTSSTGRADRPTGGHRKRQRDGDAHASVGPAAKRATSSRQATLATPAARAVVPSKPPAPEGRAMPFVTCDAGDGRYRVNPEAEAFLETLRPPLGIIAVAGKYRTGKSFLLNRGILNEPPGNGFAVGPTIQACTKGIWLYTKTIRCTPDDGGPPFDALVLDTEGIGSLDAGASHDTRVFSMALLLASYFIYNSVGSIDEAALSNLSLVANVSKQIRVSADSEAGAADLGEYFPEFLWVVRDFSLRLVDVEGRTIDSREYLESALAAVRTHDTASNERNDLRSTICGCFPRRDCVTLVRPCSDEEDLQGLDGADASSLRPAFVEQLNAMRRRLLSRIRPKQADGRPIGGRLVAALARSLVDAINAGAAPVIRDAWAMLAEVQCREALDAGLAAWDEEERLWLAAGDPVAPERAGPQDEPFRRWRFRAREAFDAGCMGVADAFRPRLEEAVDAREGKTRDANARLLERRVDAALDRIRGEVARCSTLADLRQAYNAAREALVSPLGGSPRTEAMLAARSADAVWEWCSVLVRDRMNEAQEARRLWEEGKRAMAALAAEQQEAKRVYAEALAKAKEAADGAEADAHRAKEAFEREREGHRRDTERLALEADARCREAASLAEEERRRRLEAQEEVVRTAEASSAALCDRQREAEEARIAAEAARQEATEARAEAARSLEAADEARARLGALESDRPRTEEMERALREALDDLARAQALSDESERRFAEQMAEIQVAAEEMVAEARRTCEVERDSLLSRIASLESRSRADAEEREAERAVLEQRLDIQSTQIEAAARTEREAAERHDRELEAARAEILRLKDSLEQEQCRHREALAAIRAQWAADSKARAEEASRQHDERHREQVERAAVLQSAQQDAACAHARLKDAMDRLAVLEAKANDNRVAKERDRLASELSATQKDNAWLRKDRDEQIGRVDALREKNAALDRRCKDGERQREVDLLKMRMAYDKQISVLNQRLASSGGSIAVQSASSLGS